MEFKAAIDVMPHKELLDPQGKAVAKSMKNLDLETIKDVRIGKHITLMVEAANEAAARAQVQTACEKLLSNPIMEGFEFTLEPA